MRLAATLGALAALLCLTAAASAQNYVVAAGGNTISVLGNGVSQSYSVSGASFSAVAAQGNYAYALDSAGGQVDVFGVSPTAAPNFTQSISLTASGGQVYDPNSIAVDTSGDVYVTGTPYYDSTTSTTVSNYAFIMALSGGGYSTTVSSLADSSMAGVATNQTQAAILYKNTASGITGTPAYATTSPPNTGVPITNSNALNNVDGQSTAQGPVGITSFNGAYYAIGSGSTNDVLSGYRAGWFAQLGSNGSGQARTLTDGAEYMVPESIAGFSLKGAAYLGIVGLVDGTSQEAWEITIDPTTGALVVSAKYTIADSSAFHSCSVSPDGSTFYFGNAGTSNGNETVAALNTSDWASAGSFGATDLVAGVAGFYYTPTPEPSGLLSLLAAGAGAALCLRRRRRK